MSGLWLKVQVWGFMGLGFSALGHVGPGSKHVQRCEDFGGSALGFPTYSWVYT